jgi:hypothetical protein
MGTAKERTCSQWETRLMDRLLIKAAMDFVVMAKKFGLSEVDIQQGLALIGLSKKDIEAAMVEVLP